MSIHSESVGRILSGSIASWTKILVIVITQITLVPIYLSQWNAETYGAWLLIQALWGAGILLNLALHDFVGFECLKLGATQREEISLRISSVIPVTFLIACILVLIVWSFGELKLGESLLKLNVELGKQLNQALFIMSIVYIFTQSQSGLIERWLTPFGYYPTFVWLNVLRTILTSIPPAVAVFIGADFIEAVWILIIADVIVHLYLYYVSFHIIRKQSLSLVIPNMKLGLNLWLSSLWLAARYLIDMTRQHGSRLVLAPLSTPEGVAAFATMRTGANFAQQGLITVVLPALPELMKFLIDKDQEKTESIFALVWFVTCALLAPTLFGIQLIMPDLFELWTRGKIEYNPELFACLSLTILFFALGQPFDSIVRGNNLLKSQVGIAILGAIIVIGGMVVFVPVWGIRGAGFALLLAEINVAFAFMFIARRWMLSIGMYFPWKPFLITLSSIFVTAIGLCLVVYEIRIIVSVMIIVFIIQIVISWVYWKNIPNVAKLKVKTILLKFKVRR